MAGLCGTPGHALTLTAHHQTQQQQDEVAMPYLCPFCSRRFRRRDGLVLHVRTHTGERPYSCPHCPVAFAQKSHLNRHIRTVHKVEPNAHLVPHMLMGSDNSSQKDGLGPGPASGKVPRQAKSDGQNGDASDMDIHIPNIPSPLFPHVQIINDTTTTLSHD